MTAMAAEQLEANVGAATSEVQQPQLLGDKIDQLFEKRERKRELEAELAEVKREIEALEHDLIEAMEKQGTDLARGQLATASISKDTVPEIEDWEAVLQYVKENDAFYLLHRRISTAPWRELLESGETVPGTKPFEKKSVSIRKVKKA